MKDPAAEAPLQRIMEMAKVYLLPHLSERIPNPMPPIPKPIIKQLLNNGIQTPELLAVITEYGGLSDKGGVHDEVILVVHIAGVGVTVHNNIRRKEARSIIQGMMLVVSAIVWFVRAVF